MADKHDSISYEWQPGLGAAPFTSHDPPLSDHRSLPARPREGACRRRGLAPDYPNHQSPRRDYDGTTWRT